MGQKGFRVVTAWDGFGSDEDLRCLGAVGHNLSASHESPVPVGWHSMPHGWQVGVVRGV